MAYTNMIFIFNAYVTFFCLYCFIAENAISSFYSIFRELYIIAACAGLLKKGMELRVRNMGLSQDVRQKVIALVQTRRDRKQIQFLDGWK